jgi:membrane protein YqaA with SNARE-associated domain
MSSNEKPVPFYYSLRQYGAILLTFGATLGGWLGRFADNISAPNARKTRRQLRRWLKANGLTIVLVSAILILAWIVAER